MVLSSIIYLSLPFTILLLFWVKVLGLEVPGQGRDVAECRLEVNHPAWSRAHRHPSSFSLLLSSLELSDTNVYEP